jgi:uncharacterized membrane protein YeaQ/YmgE (transglycosylase-associated protein family)
MTIGELIVLLIVGALAGSLAGMIVTGKRQGYGPFANIVVGLVGAVIGGFVFERLDVNLGLGSITLSFDKVAAALVGALILLAVISFLQRRR